MKSAVPGPLVPLRGISPMSEALSSAEINRQRAELLPARTALSLLAATGPGSKGTGAGGSPPIDFLHVEFFPNQTNTSMAGSE
jgi:hypothetical protein